MIGIELIGMIAEISTTTPSTVRSRRNGGTTIGYIAIDDTSTSNFLKRKRSSRRREREKKNAEVTLHDQLDPSSVIVSLRVLSKGSPQSAQL